MRGVHGLLVTCRTEDETGLVNLAICPVCNFIDNRGLTLRYTVFSEDLPNVIDACRKLNVTLQEIISTKGDELYPVLYQGACQPWERKKPCPK